MWSYQKRISAKHRSQKHNHGICKHSVQFAKSFYSWKCTVITCLLIESFALYCVYLTSYYLSSRELSFAWKIFLARKVNYALRKFSAGAEPIVFSNIVVVISLQNPIYAQRSHKLHPAQVQEKSRNECGFKRIFWVVLLSSTH